MKKKNLNIRKKLVLNKEMIAHLDKLAQLQVAGGISGKICEPPVSGTGCGCDMNTCGIIICTAAGCAGEVM
ncbi:MAG TPA: class I lanthipeptide [Chitinophagaceae bacterium]|nr:class I lanthipeptide [Chitinophagaceae bacterium]